MKAKVFGYCRVSTGRQSIERQARNIAMTYPDALMVRETYTGTTLSRPEFEKLLKNIKPEDTIVFDSVSRMSRNAAEGFELYEALYNRGVDLVFLKEPHISTATYRKELERQISVTVETGDKATDDLMRGILDALNKYILSLAKRQIELAFEQSEKEVMDLRQRTREGIETARRAGKQIGGHKPGVKMVIKKEAPVKELIKKHSKDFGGHNSDVEVMAIINATGKLHVARNTFYKYKRELKTAE